ncbi:hypothetical protein EDB19DRAFT_1827736 [Suillus lakei]|nr:hypothetical protein EDB19DRAFT_1827736 [Suillus lakei]
MDIEVRTVQDADRGSMSKKMRYHIFFNHTKFWLLSQQNFAEHLSDENFYEAYMTFFNRAIEEKGAAATLEEFVFSNKYNFDPGRDTASQPEMLSRFVDRVMHPLIHCGYGVEFGLKGMLSEGKVTSVQRKKSRLLVEPALGLAMTALQDAHARRFLPLSLSVAQVASDANETEVKFASLVLDDTSMTPNRTPALRKIRIRVDKRMIYISIPGEIECKMEECIWTTSVMYAVGGWSEKGFTADFFLMHLVTSALYIPSLIASLSPRAQVLFLCVYFAKHIASWISLEM